MKLDKAVEFASNPEPRCPCILLLDVSGSMTGTPINSLNDGLKAFRDDLNKDELAKKRVEVAIVAFSDTVQLVQDFVTANNFEPPQLSAMGLTQMGAGIHKALEIINARKKQYKKNGIEYYRPWVFLITDGTPTDDAGVVASAARNLKEEEAKKRVAFFAVGVQGANMSKLAEIVVRTPLQLKGLNFRELFIWLSASMQSVSHSQVGEQVLLKPPTGWAEI